MLHCEGLYLLKVYSVLVSSIHIRFVLMTMELYESINFFFPEGFIITMPVFFIRHFTATRLETHCKWAISVSLILKMEKLKQSPSKTIPIGIGARS